MTQQLRTSGAEAVKKLIIAITARVKQPDITDEALRSLSNDLCNVFSFKSADFDAFPRGQGITRKDIATYVSKQIENWRARSEALTILENIGLAKIEAVEVLQTFSRRIDQETLANWCYQKFGRISDIKIARHVLRYITAECARLSGCDYHQYLDRVSRPEFDSYSRSKFSHWSKSPLSPFASPYFDTVIQPVVRLLRHTSSNSGGGLKSETRESEV